MILNFNNFNSEVGTTAFLYTFVFDCPSHEAPFQGASFEQDAHLQFKYKLVLSLVKLENRSINVKSQMSIAHLCTKEVKGKKRGCV